jgi:hypothetical protein
VPLRAARMIDLSREPFTADAAKWVDCEDYTACQALATTARAANAQLIRAPSVRDPEHRANLALLDPTAFAAPAPTPRQSWHFRYENGQLSVLAAFPAQDRHVFTASQFGLVE